MLLTLDVSKLPTIDTSNYSYNMSRFAAAGQVVSNEALNAFNSVLNTSPDYAALQMEAMKNKAAKEIVSNKVESELFKDAIQSIAERKSDDIRIKSNLELLGKGPKQKMAGKLALMGSLIAEAAIKPKKVDLPNNIPFDRSADIAKAQAAIDASTEKIDALKALILQSKTTGDVPTNNGTPSLGNVSNLPQSTVSLPTSYTPDKDGLYNINIVDLGNRLRDNFGLTIVEHPAFGGNTGGHARGSHHDFDEAIDIQDWRDDDIDGVNWRTRTANLIDLLQGSAHETIGPNQDPTNHGSHGHVGAYGGNVKLNQHQYDILFGGNSGGLRATFGNKI